MHTSPIILCTDERTEDTHTHTTVGRMKKCMWKTTAMDGMQQARATGIRYKSDNQLNTRISYTQFSVWSKRNEAQRQ